MATKKGVWNLQQVRDKQLQSLWSYSGLNELWGWGAGTHGQIGDNSEVHRSSPVQIPGSTWKNVSINGGTADSRSFVTKTDGTLWTWGSNTNGELGLNNRTQYSSPVQVGSDTTWKQLSTTHSGSAGVKTDGTLWVWGTSTVGALGLNQAAPVSYSSPVQLGSDTDWNYVCDGSVSRKAIKTDGTLWAWGHNSQGILGQNNTTKYSSPVQIPGTTWSTTVTNVSYTALAVKTDGTLWAWGQNTQGQLGINDGNRRSSPTQIPGTDWATGRGKIAAGSNSSYAIRTDGTLWSWGYNGEGHLGLNSIAVLRYSSPVQVPGTSWDNVYSVDSWVLATRTDGTLWAWGYNGYGTIGQNQAPATIRAYSSPAQIPGSWNSPGSAISCNQTRNLVIKAL